MRLLLVAICFVFLAPSLFAQSAPPAQPAPPPSRPNILFVFIDDMGCRDLSCFGGTRVKTAEIDRLAAEGLRFNQFYVSAPICSPSRVAVLTGQYPNRWRITSFLAKREEDAQRGIADWLDPKAPSLARSLQQAGYYTAHVGKWHMGGQRDVADAPPITDYGFATSVTNFEGLGPRILPKFEKVKHGPTEMSAKFGGPGVQWEARDKVSQRFVDRAIAEIDVAQKKKQPFYINLWPDDVHSPCEAPADLRGDGSPSAQYLGVLKELDKQLGRVFEHVRATPALRDNTLIVLASDNGHERGFGSAGSLRGSKGQLYEGGIRSPLIVWGPGRLAASAKPGTINERTLIAGIDLAPSLLAVAGVNADQTIKYDGRNMSAAMLGKSSEPRDGKVMWVRPPDRPGPPNQPLPDLAIREGDLKLLVRRDGSNAELFDIAKDPDEKNNLAASHADVAKRLGDAVIAWDRSIQPKATSGNQK